MASPVCLSGLFVLIFACLVVSKIDVCVAFLLPIPYLAYKRMGNEMHRFLLLLINNL